MEDLLDRADIALSEGDLLTAVRAIAEYRKRRRDGEPEPRGSLPGDIWADLATVQATRSMKGLRG